MKVPFAIGSKVRYDGETCSVVALEGPAVRLRAPDGSLMLVATRDLLVADGFELLDASNSYGEESSAESSLLRADELEDLPDHVRERALERRDHVREVNTGYRSGNAQNPAEGEPRPEYHPSLPIAEHERNKALQLGVSVRTVRRWREGYSNRGLSALCDGRVGRPRPANGSLDPRAREALQEVIDGLTHKSNASVDRVLDEAKAILGTRYGEGTVPLPSRSTLYRRMEEITAGKSTFGNAKRRREEAARPKTPYLRLDSTRPGETVLIDATELDIFALSTWPLRWTSLELVLALDMFTRSILAWRFVPRGMKAVDAALLLRDTITPKTMRPGWPDCARWPYHGVPERIVLGAFENLDLEQEHEKAMESSEATGIAGVPVVRPETVVVDHAHAFDSVVFTEACHLLGISVQTARPYRPTDKAQIESMFRTIRLELLQRMPGYKGPDLFSRGSRVEETAYYFVHEVEEIFAEWVVRYWQNRPHDGLRVPGAQTELMSPNEAYDLGLSTAGFIHVPSQGNVYHELLPIYWRKIGHYGVTIDKLTYDGDALNPYRNCRSFHGGKHAGKWPIRRDPRDVSRAYFLDPEEETWHELGWVHAPAPNRPFNDKLLAHAKALLLARRGKPGGTDRDLAGILSEVFARVESRRLLDKNERAAIARAAVHAEQAARDRGEGTNQDHTEQFPTRMFQGDQPPDEYSEVYVEEDEEIHERALAETSETGNEVETNDQHLDPSEIEPYPVLSDLDFGDYWPGKGEDE